MIPDDSHLAFSSAVSVSEEQDDVQETTKTQLQNEITFCQSHPETLHANHEIVEVQEEPHAKEEIIIMESDSQEVMQQCSKTPGMQPTLDHYCEAESVVPSAKKIRLEELLQSQYSKAWVKLYKKQLTIKDKEIIILGECLNDLHVNFAQEIFKKQFKHILGFQSTLVLLELKFHIYKDHIYKSFIAESAIGS